MRQLWLPVLRVVLRHLGAPRIGPLRIATTPTEPRQAVAVVAV